jgi:hypothetical protein
MRSIISFQARTCLRGAVNWRYGVPCKAVRWSSTESRQWSTPLAKQLSEAITVQISTGTLLCTPANTLSGYRTNSSCFLHADVLNVRSGWILHVQARRTRSIRTKRRLYYISRDIADIWRAYWNMVRGRMDGSGQEEQGRTAG